MKILSIQSSVAYGHVGNSAAVFPLQRLGHEVWPVYTVHFSNHTGYGAWRGPLLAADDVREVITGIEERGVLGQVDAVLSGYQGGDDIGDVILDAVARVKQANPAATYTCDPVMGNAKSGCFVHPAIPVLLRERVVPQADLITPNQFELGYLTGTEPTDLESTLALRRRRAGDGPVERAGHQRRATRLAERRTPSRCSPSPPTAPGWSPPLGCRSRPTGPATSPPHCSPVTTGAPATPPTRWPGPPPASGTCSAPPTSPASASCSWSSRSEYYAEPRMQFEVDARSADPAGAACQD